MTEFFEFSSYGYEEMESLSDLGSTRYEGLEYDVSSTLFESIDDWSGTSDSDWFSPITTAEVGQAVEEVSWTWNDTPSVYDWGQHQYEVSAPADAFDWKQLDSQVSLANDASWANPVNAEYKIPEATSTTFETAQESSFSWGDWFWETPQERGNDHATVEVRESSADDREVADDDIELTEKELDLLTLERLKFEEEAKTEFVEAARSNEGLRPAVWSEATVEERFDSLTQCAEAYMKAYELRRIVLEVDPNLPPGTYGFCQDTGDGSHIVLGGWIMEMDHPKDAVETLIHEMRHAYQSDYILHAQESYRGGVVNFDLTTVENWIESTATYSDGLANYTNTAIETDADRHAKDLLNSIYIY